MERKKSLLAATIISATLFTGAVAYAASSGVIAGREDNVGKLAPTAIEPTDIMIYVDPATGSVTTTKPQAAVTPTDDSGHDSDDDTDDDSGHDSNDDRRHGRDNDDD